MKKGLTCRRSLIFARCHATIYDGLKVETTAQPLGRKYLSPQNLEEIPLAGGLQNVEPETEAVTQKDDAAWVI